MQDRKITRLELILVSVFILLFVLINVFNMLYNHFKKPPVWIEKKDSVDMEVHDFYVNHAVLWFDSVNVCICDLLNSYEDIKLLKNVPYHIFKRSDSDTMFVKYPDGRLLYLIYYK